MNDFAGFTKAQQEEAKKLGLPLVRIVIDARHIGKGGVDAKGAIPVGRLKEAFDLWYRYENIRRDRPAGEPLEEK